MTIEYVQRHMIGLLSMYFPKIKIISRESINRFVNTFTDFIVLIQLWMDGYLSSVVDLNIAS